VSATFAVVYRAHLEQAPVEAKDEKVDKPKRDIAKIGRRLSARVQGLISCVPTETVLRQY
jgi:hypothetical protein